MALSKKGLALAGIGLVLAPALFFVRARASDHADTPAIAATPGVDLTDVFVFPSPTNANNVVLVMNVHPLIPSGMGPTTFFDPDVLYQFKIDTTGNHVEDMVIQAKFTGTDAAQKVLIAGPVKPARTGTVTQLMPTDSVVGTINTPFILSDGATAVFAGAREDPFFFDLEQFFNILPDRGSTIAPPIGRNPPADPNKAQVATFNGFPGTPAAVDALKGYNVLSIVVELPKSKLGNGKIAVWCTTSK